MNAYGMNHTAAARGDPRDFDDRYICAENRTNTKFEEFLPCSVSLYSSV